MKQNRVIDKTNNTILELIENANAKTFAINKYCANLIKILHANIHVKQVKIFLNITLSLDGMAKTMSFFIPFLGNFKFENKVLHP